MKAFVSKFIDFSKKLQDIPLLLIRLVLAYGFWITGPQKLKYLDDTASWFASMGIPFPKLNAILAGGTETVGVFLLLFGLGTRFISIPLMITMLVAIVTVHLDNGFNASDNGFEIPLYYLIMLFSLFAFGPGKASIDHFIKKKFN